MAGNPIAATADGVSLVPAPDQAGLDAAAAALRRAYDGAGAIPPLRETLGHNDPATGYAVQEINTRFWLQQGRVLSGRKIGATSLAVQTMLGLDQPDYGMLFADMAFADGEQIPNARLQQPRAEGEIAFCLGADLTGPKLTIAEVITAIAFAVPAIEIVASRIADWNIGILDTIADNASAGLYVLGTTPRGLADFDMVMCGMIMTRNGVTVSTGIGAACLGNPLAATLWLARKMLEVGRPLLRGDVILSGALGPMVPVQRGDSIEVRIGGLGSVMARISD